MGKGRKTKREMNILIRVIKRKRLLKKATRKSYLKPETTPVFSSAGSNVAEAQIAETEVQKPRTRAKKAENAPEETVMETQTEDSASTEVQESEDSPKKRSRKKADDNGGNGSSESEA